jgi:hypothetical protein
MGGVDPTWDILICSIAHRTGMLEVLLRELQRQLVPGVGVRVCRDNLEASVGEKRQRLVESSQADYVSFVDDDDMVSMDYVAKILDALRERPDYIGFRVYYTEGGSLGLPAYHSLVHGDWFETDQGLYRDISHLNPIRRELALKARFDGGRGEDVRWASDLRKLGCIRSEIWVDGEVYWYRHYHDRGFTVSSTQPPMPLMPPLSIDLGWVTWVD